MANEKRYPRVLIVYHSCINRADQHGVSIRGWFADWPKEHLAQIYSGGESGQGAFCGRTFKLGSKERLFGKLFFELKNSGLGNATLHGTKADRRHGWTGPSIWLDIAMRAIGRLVLDSGLWELLFRPKLSRELRQWIREFQPQLIYCQGYSLGFTWLPLMLQKEYALPICFQTGDDWPRYMYASSPLSFLMSPLTRISARRLIHGAVVRLSNGETMSEEYLRRYKVPFEPLMMCDDYSRFKASACRRVVDESKISVVYTGSLGSMRCAPLIELCTAAQQLQAEGFDITVTALATSVPPEAVELLSNTANLTVLPAPCHEQLPTYLKGADVLFLPESLNESYAESIRHSISTKAHLYMMSERPVLIYGHKTTGIMDYARRAGWACLVDQQDLQLLKAALRKLITDESYCQQLVTRGRETALSRHDAAVIREKFRQLLSDAGPGRVAAAAEAPRSPRRPPSAGRRHRHEF